MDLAELFTRQGLGVMSTASKEGVVNSAVYARPHVIDEKTLVWGTTDRRTFQNLKENPHAAYLYKTSSPGFEGIRLGLQMIRSEESGKLLEAIKQNTDQIVGPGAGDAVTHAIWFRVVEIRPLI